MKKYSTGSIVYFCLGCVMVAIIMLMSISSVFGQTIHPAYQRNISGHSNAYELTAAITENYKSDRILAGILLDQFGSKVHPSIRTRAEITLNDWSFIGIGTDIAFKGNFLEPNASIGVLIRGFNLSAVYAVRNYDWNVGRNREDVVSLRFGYSLKLNQ